MPTNLRCTYILSCTCMGAVENSRDPPNSACQELLSISGVLGTDRGLMAATKVNGTDVYNAADKKLSRILSGLVVGADIDQLEVGTGYGANMAPWNDPRYSQQIDDCYRQDTVS